MPAASRADPRPRSLSSFLSTGHNERNGDLHREMLCFPLIQLILLPAIRSRDRLVVRTLRCGRSNPGSNPGHDTKILKLSVVFDCVC